VEVVDPFGSHAWQFFPGVAGRGQASPVTVAAGQTISGMDAALVAGG